MSSLGKNGVSKKLYLSLSPEPWSSCRKGSNKGKKIELKQLTVSLYLIYSSVYIVS